MTAQMEAQLVQLQACMYQYSRAIYRSIKDLIDPYAESAVQLESRRSVLEQCEQTMERLAADPHYFAKPDRALFQDIRRFFPITAQAQVAWAVKEGVGAAVGFIEEQLEAGALDGGVARCRSATTAPRTSTSNAASRPPDSPSCRLSWSGREAAPSGILSWAWLDHA